MALNNGIQSDFRKLKSYHNINLENCLYMKKGLVNLHSKETGVPKSQGNRSRPDGRLPKLPQSPADRHTQLQGATHTDPLDHCETRMVLFTIDPCETGGWGLITAI